jgi:hypothetical protein
MTEAKLHKRSIRHGLGVFAHDSEETWGRLQNLHPRFKSGRRLQLLWVHSGDMGYRSFRRRHRYHLRSEKEVVRGILWLKNSAAEAWSALSESVSSPDLSESSPTRRAQETVARLESK